MEKRTDEELLAAVRGGDEHALVALLERHAPRVLRFGMKMCHDRQDAEDVLQETLLAAARGIREMRGAASLSTWLYTIARSFCIKKRRHAKHAPAAMVPIDEHVQDELAAPGAQPDEAASTHEIAAALQGAIRRLDEDYREVLILRDVEGLTAPEVAAVLNVSVDAVKSRLHRARAEVRARLAPLFKAPTQRTPSSCPDAAATLSRILEGDLGPQACEAMQEHVATCTSCAAVCESLRRSVALCHAAGGELGPNEKAQVRKALTAAIGSSGGAG